MRWLPLFWLELTRRGRRGSTYIMRLVPVVAACGVVYALFLQYAGVGSLGELVALLSHAVFMTAIVTEFAVALVFAPAITAGAIAEERQARSLPLLTLANITPGHTCMAKFLACYMQTVWAILGWAPILAIATITGGITMQHVLLNLGVFACINAMMCAAGILASAAEPVPRLAYMRVTQLIVYLGMAELLAWRFQSFVPSLAALAPSRAVVEIVAPAPSLLNILGPCGVCLALAVVCLLLAAERLKRPVAETDFVSAHSSVRQRAPEASPLSHLFEASLDQNQSVRRPLWHIIKASIQSVLALLFPPSACLFAANTIYDITSSMRHALHNGALDTILLTGTPVEQISMDMVRAYARRLVYYVPAFTLCDVGVIALGLWTRVDIGPYIQSVVLLLVLPVLVVVGVAKLRAVCALSCMVSTWDGPAPLQTMQGSIFCLPLIGIWQAGYWWLLYTLARFPADSPKLIGAVVFVYLVLSWFGGVRICEKLTRMWADACAADIERLVAGPVAAVARESHVSDPAPNGS